MVTFQSGAVAHVCLHSVPITEHLVNQDKPQGLTWYDEGPQYIFLGGGNRVAAYSLTSGNQRPVWVVSAGDGEAITALRASLDGSVLAVQRSSAFLQFVHVRSSKMFVQGPKSKAHLLCFFWCPSSACDFVMATSHGLELYQRMPAGQGLKYKGSCKHPTAWCIYSHESRIALLATGEGGLWLQSRHTNFQTTLC